MKWLRSDGFRQTWGPMLASVALLSLAFPPFNVFLLVFLAPAPWIASLRHKTGRQAAISGYFFGALLFAGQMFWVAQFVGKWTGSAVMGAVPWLIATLLAGFYYVLLAWLINLCWRLRWPWMIPLVWAGLESLRAFMPVLAFPWVILANPLWLVPAIGQPAAFGTVFLVSAWVLIPSILIAGSMSARTPEERLDLRSTTRLAMAFAGISILGATRLFQTPSTFTQTITLGQPGVDMAFTTPEEEAAQLRRASLDLLNAAVLQKSNLLILPEGYAGDVPLLPPQTPLGERPPVNIIMGGARRTDKGIYQAAFTWDGQEWEFGDKTRLVAFGEYVPFREFLPFASSFNVIPIDLIPGQTLVTPKVGEMRLGPLICFEGLFPDLAAHHAQQGAQVLVQMSIDDWYEFTPAHEQLWQSSVWRSIESGLPLVRVGARGKSLATDDRGRLIARAPIGRTAPVKVTLNVPFSSDAFPHRMYFVYLCWALCAGLIGLAVARRVPDPSSESG